MASIASSAVMSKDCANSAGSMRLTISCHIHSSDRDSPTGGMAACWICRYGCSGVAVRSVFSYQVAAGSTMSAHLAVSVIWWSTTTTSSQPSSVWCSRFTSIACRNMLANVQISALQPFFGIGDGLVHGLGAAAHEVDAGDDLGLDVAEGPPGRGVHADLVLAHVDGEAAARAADVAGEGGEQGEGAPGQVAVEPVVAAAAHDDGGRALGGVSRAPPGRCVSAGTPVTSAARSGVQRRAPRARARSPG